jgi:hypothetical protein
MFPKRETKKGGWLKMTNKKASVFKKIQAHLDSICGKDMYTVKEFKTDGTPVLVGKYIITGVSIEIVCEHGYRLTGIGHGGGNTLRAMFDEKGVSQ